MVIMMKIILSNKLTNYQEISVKIDKVSLYNKIKKDTITTTLIIIQIILM